MRISKKKKMQFELTLSEKLRLIMFSELSEHPEVYTGTTKALLAWMRTKSKAGRLYLQRIKREYPKWKLFGMDHAPKVWEIHN